MVDISIVIENTNCCGANCLACPREKYRHSLIQMPESLFEKVIDEVYDYGIRQVDIGGYGDPLLDRMFPERLKYLKENYPDMRVTTISTCQFLEGEIADAVAEYVDDLKISHYGFSKESFEAVHRGSLVYEKVRENIEKFLEREKRPTVMMAYLILDENKDEVESWREYWIDKVEGMQIWYPHNYAGGKPEYNEITPKDNLKVHSCGRPGKEFAVWANGEVSCCCFDFNHDLVVGNLHEQSFSEILQGERLRVIKDFHQRKTFFESKTICAECDQIFCRDNALFFSKDSSFKVGEKSQKR